MMASLNTGSEIELNIDGLTYGDGVGRFEGRVCFVRGALPGERVKARVTVLRKQFIRAGAVSILKPSPSREDAPCIYYGECGGCQYQHVSYAEELQWKEEQVKENLRRIGNVWPECLEPIVPSPEIYGYRNSITVAQGELEGRRGWGFYALDNTSIIPVEKCLIARAELNQFLHERVGAKEFQHLTALTVKCNEKGDVVDDSSEVLFRVRVLERDFWASSRGFFQINIPVVERLIEKIRSWISSLENFELFDVYAGVGLFGVLCGEKAKAVYALESHPSSVQGLRKNFQSFRKGFYQISTGTAESRLGKLLEKGNKGAHRVVILDPPREGLSKGMIEILKRDKTISHLIYISCEPSRLARDLNLICGGREIIAGNAARPPGRSYRLVSVAPFDMFPRTKHVEAAALLISKS